MIFPPPCGEGRLSEAEAGVGVERTAKFEFAPPDALFAALTSRHPPHKGEGETNPHFAAR